MHSHTNKCTHIYTYYEISCLLSYGKIVFTKSYIGQFLSIISFTFFWPNIQWQISFHPTPLTLIVTCCFIVSLFAVSDANVSLLYSVSASSTPFQQADEWQYYDSIKPILKYSSTAASIYLLFPIDICSVSVKLQLQPLSSTLVYDANLKASKTKRVLFHLLYHLACEKSTISIAFPTSSFSCQNLYSFMLVLSLLHFQIQL